MLSVNSYTASRSYTLYAAAAHSEDGWNVPGGLHGGLQVKHQLNNWAVVLAAGDGSRLRGLKRDERGIPIPKQFCSLQGGHCLWQEALQRAAAVAPLQRICSVVSEQHRQWWMPILSYLPEQNVIAQPLNRGTAYGILLPLLRIFERDPEATVVLLPADHYLRDEEVMTSSLRRAAELANADRGSIYLLAVEPDEPATELCTPERVGAILDRLGDSVASTGRAYFPAHVSLADQYLRMHLTRTHREIRI